MKIKGFLIATLIAATALVSCKKESNNSSNTAIEGRWVGLYGFDNDKPSEFYSFQFKSNGVLEEYGETGNKIGVGKWKLENNVLTGYTISTLGSNNKYSVIAAYDAKNNKLLGNWGFDESTTDGGLWEMQKQ